MANGKNVGATLDECIKKLQNVKKQWSSSIKEAMYVLERAYMIEEVDDETRTLMQTQKDYNTTKTNNEQFYNSKTVQNASVYELIQWAIDHGKVGKLGKIIDRYGNDVTDLYTSDGSTTKNTSPKTAEVKQVSGPQEILNRIKQYHRKKKVKDIKLVGGQRGSGDFMIELIMAIIDSLVRFYDEDKHDKKDKLSYAGIKGKKIYETFLQPAKGESKSQFLKNAEDSRININKLKQNSLTTIMNVLTTYNKSSAKNTNSKDAHLVNTTTNKLVKCIGTINEDIKTISKDLEDLTTDFSSAPQQTP